MDTIRNNSLTVIVIYKDGNTYTINRVIKIEKFFNRDSRLSLRIYYETNADGYVDVCFIYDDIDVILIKGE